MRWADVIFAARINFMQIIHKSINTWDVKLGSWPFIYGKFNFMSYIITYVCVGLHSHAVTTFITIINICIIFRCMGLTRITSVYPFDGCYLHYVGLVSDIH